MTNYNKRTNLIKLAIFEARGHERDIYAIVGDVDRSLLDGHPHPCPRCGTGDDRFYYNNDNDTIRCRQCFNRGNPDVVNTLAWLLGDESDRGQFEAGKQILSHLNIDYEANGKSKARPSPVGNASSSPDKRKPLIVRTPLPAWRIDMIGPPVAEQIDWDKLDERQGHAKASELHQNGHDWLTIYAHRKGIPDAKSLIAFGAMGRNGEKDFAFPEYNEDGRVATWFCVNVPKGGKGTNVTGCRTGVFLPTIDGKPRLPKAGETWLVTEGCKDAAALHSLGYECVIGLPGKSLSKYHAPMLNGCDVTIVPDHDVPGDRGAKKTARVLETAGVKSIKEAKLLDTPRPEKDGPDVRDVLRMNDGEAKVRKAIEEAKEIPLPPEYLIENHIPCDDGPVASTFEQVLSQVDDVFGPNHFAKASGRKGDCLVCTSQSGVFREIYNATQLFSYFRAATKNQVRWSDRVSTVLTKAEFFEELLNGGRCRAFKMIQDHPHFPPLENIYYAASQGDSSSNGKLDELVDLFKVQNDVDRELLKSQLITQVWGGEGKTPKRPVFGFTTEENSQGGTGAGKTTAVEVLSSLTGGCIEMRRTKDIDQFVTNYLSGDRRRRNVLIDNNKGKINWAEFEALTTREELSGRQNFRGQVTVPNILVFNITGNQFEGNFSLDASRRTVVIKLPRPRYEPTWEARAKAFVAEHSEEILANIKYILESRGQSLQSYSRWAQWEADVLCKLREPELLQRTILERQRWINGDSADASAIEEFFESKLIDLHCDTVNCKFYLPVQVVSDWLSELERRRYTAEQARAKLYELHAVGTIQRLHPHRIGQRSFAWVGKDAMNGMRVVNDIEQRIARICDDTRRERATVDEQGRETAREQFRESKI